MKNRVVITGMGVVSPIGNSCNTFLKSLQNGANGITHITSFDTEKFNVKIAGEVNIDLDSLKKFDSKLSKLKG